MVDNIGDFKNFHRLLCERFNYPHDEEFWWRDLLSLIEHIAAERDALKAELEAARKQEPIGWVLEKIGCRAPDDCEDYLDFHEMGKVDAEELAYYLNQGRAFQVYASPVPAQQSELPAKSPTL